MSLFTESSLCLVPSGVKDGKVYSIKPTDGSGDLTFTRSNDTASRIASNGLIEKVRTNLALYSEQFDNAGWLKATLSVTANAGTAPDGTTTADLIYPSANSSNSVIYNGITVANSTEYTNSIYVKASGKTWVFVRGINDGNGVFFDLTSGVVGTMQGDAKGTITSVGSGWYRCSVTQTSSSTTGRIVTLVVDGDASTSVTASGTDGLLIWGAQQETGVMTQYIGPTTSAAVSVGPVANLPRLDYSGGASCPSLLLEPQRTNFATYNEAFSNWSPNAGTITSNATTSPDGYVDADLFTEDTTTGYHRFANSCTGATGTAKAYSIYAKWAGGTGRKWLTLDNGPVSYFDLENGLLGIVGANCTNSITAVGNGWYRCVMIHTASSVGTMYVGTSNTNGGAGNHLGNGQPAFYVWGAQCEANASYPTSVIPTLGAAVTRGADMSGTTNYFGAQTFAGDFTFFVDLLPMEGNTVISDAMILGGGDYNGGGDFQSYFRFASGDIILKGVAETSIIASSYTMTANQPYKILVTRTGTTVKIFANGAQVGASATSSATVILRSLGWSYTQVSYNYDGRINQVLLMPSGLTDAQAIELTTI